MTTLKLQNRRWYPFIFLAGSAAAVALLHPALGYKPEQLLSGIGAIAAFTYFLYHQHLDATKLFKELFVEFNARYDKMKNDLNKIVYGPKGGDLSETERELLFGYFNLCSEQYLFYKAGYIDHDVWKSWRKGMGMVLEHPRVSSLWKSESGNNSYYGFT